MNCSFAQAQSANDAAGPLYIAASISTMTLFKVQKRNAWKPQTLTSLATSLLTNVVQTSATQFGDPGHLDSRISPENPSLCMVTPGLPRS